MTRRSFLAAASLLLALGVLAACSSSDDKATSKTTTTKVTASKAKSSLRFAPVLGSRACGGATSTTAKAEGSPTTQFLPQPGQLNCWWLGEDVGTANDLTAAEVVSTTDGGGSAAVQVRVRPASRKKMNDLFNACYHDTPTCPTQLADHGSVAVILDGEVRSAPSIASPNLANKTIQLTGLTTTEAEALAELINS